MRLELRYTLAGLVICCLSVLAAFLSATDEQLDFLFGSDALYLPSIYRDITSGAGFAGLMEWYFNPSPNFFPDMGLYCLLNWVFGDLRAATYAYAIVQVIIIILLFRGILERAGIEHGKAGIALGILLMSLLTMVGHWANDFNVTFQILINSYHTGAFVNALLSVWLLLRWIDRKQWHSAFWLGLVVMLASASDKLYWIMFTIPVALSCSVLSIRREGRKPLLMAAALILLCTWLGDHLLHELDDAFPLTIATSPVEVEATRIQRSWKALLGVFHWYLDTHPLLVWCAVLPVLAISWSMVQGPRTTWSWVRATEPSRPLGSYMVVLMTAQFFIYVLFAPVLSGTFFGGDSIRYNFAILMLAPLVLGVILGKHLPRISSAFSAVIAVVLGIQALVIVFTTPMAHILRYKPIRVAALERLAEKRALRNGVANYWDAKVITMFSDHGLNVLPVYGDLSMCIRVNRPDMFVLSNDGSPLVFNYVVGHDELSVEMVTSVLASPVNVVTDPPVAVMLTRDWEFDPNTRHPRALEANSDSASTPN